MTPFLYQVAREYVDREADSLLDYCFVFPNKRSATFFSHYMREVIGDRPVIMPEITTIAGFTSSFSRLVPATRFEQLFLLYDCYRHLSQDIPDFDRFLFWGEMLISDFNDVDRYLVDPASLFVNVKKLKEINSNYLTPDQLDIIRAYWGQDVEEYDPDRFWTHLSDTSTGLQDKFLKLWEILLPLYTDYCAGLRKRSLASEGMLLREAVEAVKNPEPGQLQFKRYIFVGFNVLSAAEVKIFERLKARGLADFYWDFNSLAFDMPGSKGARFMRRNIESFPSLYTIDSEKITRLPQITITCVPSKVGMVKETGRILHNWVKDGVIDTSRPTHDTAIVLPEEDLFIPMIHSVPAEITDLNVTMGFPLKLTPMASLLNAITSMQMRSADSHGERVFFHEDVKAILSHPLMQSGDMEACNTLLATLKLEKMYTVSSAFLSANLPEDMAVIFATVSDLRNAADVYQYTRRVVDYLLSRTFSEGKAGKIERYFLESFSDALEELYTSIREWNIQMRDATFFHILRRSLASAAVNFTGEPLKGLQMMGVLETRALDFENIVILSMNERVFPRKHFTRSFIPDTLRRAYRMSTVEYQESIYAYYFYRLISRARRVELLYDGRTEGTRSGEMSRYLSQLLYLFPDAGIVHKRKVFPAPRIGDETIVIEKTPDIMARLNCFLQPDGEGRKYLSASSINSYINCPLSFYLKNVEGLDLDDEITDYMDSGTFGTILHEVMEHIYKRLRGNAHSVIITSEVIDSISRHLHIEPYVTRSINYHFRRKGRDCDEPLVGESLLIGRVMTSYVEMLLRAEKAFTPFEFIDAEMKVEGRMEVAPGLVVNFKQIIDRVDRIYPDSPDGGVMRVVDYKTGQDKISFTSVADLFDRSKTDRRKAILQLMFYSNMLARKLDYDGPIQPVIYLFKTIATHGILPITFNRKPLEDYRSINDEFISTFNSTVAEIFDPAIPFTQADDSHACTFCNFKSVCGRKTADE